MTDRRFVPRDLAAPAAIIAVLAAVSAFGFRGIFPNWAFVTAAVVGAVGATLVMFLGRWARLAVAETLAVSLVVFVLLGAVAAQGVPTPSAFGTFFDGLIKGWAQVLSSTPPADLTAEFRVLPYAVAWFGAMLGGEILRSSRTPGLGVLGPVAGLGLSLLITLENRNVALVQGLVMAAGALMLSFVQQRRQTRDAELFEDFTINEETRYAGVVAAVGVAAAIAAAAPFVGPRLPLAEANDRFDLRQYQTPPFDPLDQPSPLVQLKTGLQDRHKEKVLFTVNTEERIDRIVLAVLDDYNREFWAVADEDGDARAEFKPVDSIFPGPPDADVSGWDRSTAMITIVDLDRLANGDFDPAWLPTLGWPLSIDSSIPLDVRFNAATGTVALAPDGPSEGLQYTIVSAMPPAAAEIDLRGEAITEREPLDLSLATLRDFAADVVEGSDPGIEQIEAIKNTFAQGSYTVEAGSSEARPGHSLGRIGEFVEDPERIVGFEEQYAATAALIARNQGLPTRVVVGYLIDEDVADDRWDGNTLSVKGEDMSAWIEVRFDDYGWLPFDVTPDRENMPEEASAGRSEREVAVPNPPPDPPPPVLPPQLDREEEFEEEEQNEEEEELADGGAGFPVKTVALGAAASSPVLLLLGGGVAVAMLKKRRTKRRRNANNSSRKVAGAWHEVVDRYHEMGVVPRRTATPKEVARGLEEASLVAPAQGPLLLALADDVDQAAFHPTPASEQRAVGAWRKSDQILAGISGQQGRWGKLRHRVDPRPLFRKDPLSTEDDDE